MMCDKCIHNHICCDEGKDEGLTFCADFMEERKRGYWVNNHNGTFTCTECGTKHSKSNWCPNCGASMDKEEGD